MVLSRRVPGRPLVDVWPALDWEARAVALGELWAKAHWDAGHVVALLDLKYALLAPVELDLNELVKNGYAPSETPDLPPGPDGSGLACLRQAVTDIVADTCSTPGAADRLFGFSILLGLWLTEKWLSEWIDGEPNTDWPPT